MPNQKKRVMLHPEDFNLPATGYLPNNFKLELCWKRSKESHKFINSFLSDIK